MAGKIQKPYEQLRNKRGGRRRANVVQLPAVPLSPEAIARRDVALNVTVSAIERAFGRGKIPKVSEATTPRERPKRKYRPKAERRETPAKAKVAAERPRDARGHFLPSPNSRRARIRAAQVERTGLERVTGNDEALLAALAAQETPQAG